MRGFLGMALLLPACAAAQANPTPPSPGPAAQTLGPGDPLSVDFSVAETVGEVGARDEDGSTVTRAAPKERSPQLLNGLFNPMPGGILAGYRADTGLDIAGFRRPVHAIAGGSLDYSEPGHTLWTGRNDSPYCVRLRLDVPIPWRGREITHVYYAHLHEIVHRQPEGAAERIRVEGGERLGTSGTANGSPHLHLGLLLDGEVDQAWGTYLLEDEVREVLGGYQKGTTLR
jgi:hypothetical protein